MKKFFARRRYGKAIEEAAGLMEKRRGAEGREVLRRAAADAAVAFGDTGPDVATVRYVLAASELEDGELDAALEDARAAERAMATFTKETFSDAPSPARVRALIASILEKKGAPADEHEEALDKWAEAASAEGDFEGAGAAKNQLGLAAGRRGDRDTAAKHFLEALAHRTKHFGATGLPTLETLYNAATYRDAQRTLDVVAADLEKIASALESRKGARESELFESALHNLGALREEQGDVGAAETAFERALTAKEKRLGKEDLSLRPTLVRLAQLHHRHGRVVHALGLYDRALVIAKKQFPDDHPIVVALEAWRAEVTQGVGPEAVRRKN